MKNTIVIIIFVVTAFIIGLFLGGKYLGEGEVVLAMCVLGDTAIEEGYLSEEELMLLTESTGKAISDDYPFFVSSIQLSNDSISRASENSRCSQIMVALSKGIK